MSSRQVPVFETLIVPYRSLTSRGVTTVAASLMVLNAMAAGGFWWLGAWPVTAFCLLEGPLLLLLLAVNLRNARASELIMLNAREITVIRTDPAGRRKFISLPSAWLRIDLAAAGGASRVVLSSHGHGCEVGAFLHQPDRMSLFEALHEALHSIRNPCFENPQLRDAQLSADN
jgi:uncharacterized membrane protein